MKLNVAIIQEKKNQKDYRKVLLKKHTSDDARILRPDNASVRLDKVLLRRGSFNLTQNNPKYKFT